MCDLTTRWSERGVAVLVCREHYLSFAIIPSVAQLDPLGRSSLCCVFVREVFDDVAAGIEHLALLSRADRFQNANSYRRTSFASRLRLSERGRREQAHWRVRSMRVIVEFGRVRPNHALERTRGSGFRLPGALSIVYRHPRRRSAC